MQKYKWKSNFHDTVAYSTLNEEDVHYIRLQYLDSKDPDYRKLKRLENTLCGIKGCCCGIRFVGVE